MDPSTKARIETLVASSPIFVFMKGSKLMPQCGFSTVSYTHLTLPTNREV